MNIHVKDSTFRDPFEQSDRGGLHVGAGKGDAPRTIADENFRETMERIQQRNPDGSRNMDGFKQVRPGVYRKVYADKPTENGNRRPSNEVRTQMSRLLAKRR